MIQIRTAYQRMYYLKIIQFDTRKRFIKIHHQLNYARTSQYIFNLNHNRNVAPTSQLYLVNAVD